MINSKKEYNEYFKEDLVATGIYNQKWKYRFFDRRRKFYKSLRKTEYFINTSRTTLRKLYAKFLHLRHLRLCNKYGWTIPINVFGKGLAIVHVGTIVVSSKARVGEYCRIHVGVNIGSAWVNDIPGAPTIGDFVYIGPGAKLFGPIEIGNKTVIGANSVVNKSYKEGNCTIGGVPAKLLSMKNSDRYIFNFIHKN